MIEIKEYLDASGRSPFAEWFMQLDAHAAAKVTATLARMEAGNLSEVKGLGGGLLERRIHSGPGYRIYFGREGKAIIILLGGGTKRGQDRDIRVARVRWRDYRRRRQEDQAWH